MATVADADIQHYEGLVRSTASRYVARMAGAAMDFDDICAILRIKVWRALEAYDPAKWDNRDRYIFMCVKNQGKDLIKRRRMENDSPALHIEDVAPARGTGEGSTTSTMRDAFELRYLSVSEEAAYMAVLDEPPLIPSTLTHNERRVLKMLYNDYRQAEIGPFLHLSTSQVKSCVKAIREKFEDWRPTPRSSESEPALQATAPAP